MKTRYSYIQNVSVLRNLDGRLQMLLEVGLLTPCSITKEYRMIFQTCH